VGLAPKTKLQAPQIETVFISGVIINF